MPNIRNKKRDPLKNEHLKVLYPKGVAILECDDGICLICRRDPVYDRQIIVFGGEDSADKTSDCWWVDLQGILKGEFLPKNASMSRREPLEYKANEMLLGVSIRPTLSL